MAVAAAAAGAAAPLGSAAGVRAEDGLMGFGKSKAEETGFSKDRLAKIEPDDLKREMPDDAYFKAVMQLNPLQRFMALEGTDEKPFSGKTVNGYKWSTQEQGVYVSAISGAELFSSAARYDSKDGQLSFWAPISARSVIERIDVQDRVNGKPQEEWRIQVVDRISKTHLGHIYSDGPEPSRKRYKINAGVLRFVPGAAPPGEAEQALEGWKFQ